MKLLPKAFFERDAVQVAPELLGKIIQVGKCKARIVETEAYSNDPASHAFKRTERSAIMFDTYGHAYVYFIYGMYWCLNFTTNRIGEGGAVLIRAVEPLSGIEEMKKLRKGDKITNLCSGPGKLCQALGIDKKMNGTIIGQKIKLFDDGYIVTKISKSSRIGIKEALDLEWRFYIEGNKWISKVK